MNPNTQQPIPLDPNVVALSKAMIQHESAGNFNAKGKSGEYGAAQWQEPTWNAEAKKYLGYVPKWGTDEMTPDVQKAVLYSHINDLKTQGLNPAQIAAQHNSGTSSNWENKVGTNSYGVKYDVPAYVKSVTDLYQSYKQQGTEQAPQQPTQPVEQSNPSGAWFPSSPTDTPLESGMKTAGNLIPSAWNFAKGILSTINPINTVKNLAQIPGEAMGLINDKGSAGSKLGNLAQGAYESVVPEAGRALVSGNLPQAQQAITNDPVGQIAPFLLAAEGGAKAIDSRLAGTRGAIDAYKSTATGQPVTASPGLVTDALNNGISKTAKIVTNPVEAVGNFVSNIASGITKSAASHITGLDAQTITKIIESPEAFSKLKQDQVSRGGLANEFGKAVDDVEATLQETGKGYDPIRTNKGIVALPEDFITKTLNDFGLKIEAGKVVADSNSITRNTSDLNALQHFVDNWGDKTTLTPNEYLNMRKDIAGIAKFGKEIGTNKDAQVVGTKLYERANETIRPQVPGLKELDAEYAPRIQQFNQIKKDFLTKDQNGEYVFKDNAVSKIANAGNKDTLLARMEEVLPGITKKIQILKAVEDIERAKGIKVGSYARGAIEGFGIVTGNVPAVVAAIVTNPAIAVPLIRGLGWGAGKVIPVLSTLKMIAGDINHLKVPQPVKSFMNQPIQTSVQK